MKWLTILLLLTPLAALSAEESDRAINERQQAPLDGRVEVSNISGEVKVSGWDEPAIEITGTLGRGVERLDFVRDGNLTVIEVVYPKNGRNSGGSYLHIRIPRASSLEVAAVSAPIRVKGVQGPQRLKTVSGDISTEAFTGDVEAETVSGDLTVSGTDTAIHTLLKTVSGSIETTAVSGDLEASTISGGIESSGSMLSRAILSTTSGRITLEAGLTDPGRFDLSTTNGRIRLMLDQDADLDLDAQTFNGSIKNCFGVEASKDRYTPERTLRLQNGEADRKVRIRSMNGGIDVCAESLSG